MPYNTLLSTSTSQSTQKSVNIASPNGILLNQLATRFYQVKAPFASENQETKSVNSNGNKQINYSRYKTELCRQYSENGECKYGEKCQFAHGFDDLKDVSRHPKYKTDFCKTFHSKGFCPYGPRCHFIHEISDNFDMINPTLSLAKFKSNLIANTVAHTNTTSSTTITSNLVCSDVNTHLIDNIKAISIRDKTINNINNYQHQHLLSVLKMHVSIDKATNPPIKHLSAFSSSSASSSSSQSPSPTNSSYSSRSSTNSSGSEGSVDLTTVCNNINSTGFCRSDDQNNNNVFFDEKDSHFLDDSSLSSSLSHDSQQ